MNEFLTWVYEQAGDRGWSINRMAAQMGFSHAAVHATLNGKNAVTFDFCAALAKALGMPAEDVFRRAGLLPPIPSPHDVRYITEAARALDADNVKSLREFADYLLYRKKRGDGGDGLKTD